MTTRAASAALAAALAIAPGCALVERGSDGAGSDESAAVADACGPADEAPDDLRCTGLYADWAAKAISPRARPYAPAVAFWSDAADKSRWIDLPDGAAIDASDPDDWRFPVGTKAWKELRVGGKLVETRYFAKVRDDRWTSAVYVWSPDGEAATRSDGGDVDVGGAVWHVPTRAECNQCHAGKTDRLLGFEAVSLGQASATGLTLAGLAAEGRLSPPPGATSLAIPDDGTGRASAALAWMHVNCGTSCHNGHSGATAYGTKLRLRVGVDEIRSKPIAAWDAVTTTRDVAARTPTWAGETRLVPGDPDASLLVRLVWARGAEQMPPIATKLVDPSGAYAVAAWIAAMPRERGLATPARPAPGARPRLSAPRRP